MRGGVPRRSKGAGSQPPSPVTSMSGTNAGRGRRSTPQGDEVQLAGWHARDVSADPSAQGGNHTVACHARTFRDWDVARAEQLLTSPPKMSTTKRDYYEVLGVGRDASEADLKKAFRGLAREYHPDVNGDPSAEARFKEIGEAYEVLSNAEQRSVYDRYGHDGLRASGGGPSAGFGSFQDLFNAFFGGNDPFGFGQRGPTPGDDLLVGAEISFVESAVGVSREIDVDADNLCQRCDGRGYPADAKIDECETCAGQGQIRRVARSALGQVVRTQACPACAGRGAIVRDRCPDCRGAGTTRERRRVTVEIPAGIAHGQRIRMTGKGNAGEPGAQAGDLYVEVNVTADERFERERLDILTRARVGATEAMVGATVSIPTIEGEASIEIPAGTQSGHEIRLRGKGFPSIQGRGRGDEIVIVDVRIPKVTDDEGRRLALELHEHVEKSGDREGLLGRIRGAFK